MIPHSQIVDYAVRAYDDESTKGAGHSVRYNISLHESHAFQILAVQGSDANPQDWIRNTMNAFPAYDREIGKGVWGYHRASKRLAKAVEKDKKFDPLLPILVTGHSAGAGVGAYTAKRLKKRGYDVVEFVGFATPRLGKNPLCVPATLYNHSGDPVCDLPPWWGIPKHAVQIMLEDVSPGWKQHSKAHYQKAMKEQF